MIPAAARFGSVGGLRFAPQRVRGEVVRGRRSANVGEWNSRSRLPHWHQRLEEVRRRYRRQLLHLLLALVGGRGGWEEHGQ